MLYHLQRGGFLGRLSKVLGGFMSDINAIILEFVDASINNGIAQENGNSNQANKFYRVIQKKIKWLNEHGEICNPIFLKLFLFFLVKVIYSLSNFYLYLNLL